MKNFKLSVIALIALLSTSCVQKSYEREVTLLLNVANIKDIKTVGLRGKGKPLSWREDLAMNPIKKDSLYSITFKCVTGYKFGEIKFVVNGELELKEKPNRRIYYNEKGTTIYGATYDVEKK